VSGSDRRAWLNRQDERLTGFLRYYLAGEGSSNYVVFDDAIITILRKYGLLGAVGAGSIVATQPTEQEQPDG
jgi:hypothetical protein